MHILPRSSPLGPHRARALIAALIAACAASCGQDIAAPGAGTHPELSGDTTVTQASTNAFFTYSCTTNTNTCYFDATGSLPAAGVSSYNWKFGDGTSAGGAKLGHTYVAGSYTVQLLIIDNAGGRWSTSASVNTNGGSGTSAASGDGSGSTTTTPTAPSSSTGTVAIFTYTCANSTCYFDASASQAAGGAQSYNWKFGDGTSAGALKVGHTYAGPGPYTVSMMLIDNQGGRDTATATVSPNGSSGTAGGGGTTTTTTSTDTTSSAPAPAPSPSPLPSGGSNEPSGMTVITNRPFNSVAQNATDYSGAEGWQPTEYRHNGAIVSDATAPRSPTSVLRLDYPPMTVSSTATYSPINAWLPIGGAPHTAYVSAWLKLSSNWVGHPSQANKLIEVFIANGPRVVLGAYGGFSAALYPKIAINGGPDPRRGDYLPENVAPIAMSRGQWHRLEFVVVSNTPGVRNGQARWWLDGQLAASYSDIEWVATWEPNDWMQVDLDPLWGGLGGTLTQLQSLYVDHIYVSVK